MFGKLKGTFVWAVILAIPVAIAVFAVKYISSKHQGETVAPEEVVEDTKEFIKKVFNFLK